jgi:hypothetical protein
MTAAIYARKSTDQSGISDEQRPVARQVEHARAYPTGKGWRVLTAKFWPTSSSVCSEPSPTP